METEGTILFMARHVQTILAHSTMTDHLNLFRELCRLQRNL